MASKVICVGFGTPVLNASSEVTTRFILTLNGRELHCTNATVNARQWTHFWELIDASDDSVVDTSPEENTVFDIATEGTYYTRFTVNTKSAQGVPLTSPELDVIDGGDGGGGEIEIPDTTAPSVPTGLTVLVANDTTISGTFTSHPDADGDLATVTLVLGTAADVTEGTALDILTYDKAAATAGGSIAFSFSGNFSNATYKLRIKAEDNPPASNVSAWSAAVDAVVNVAPPAAPGAPTITSATAPNDHLVVLAITPGSGEGGGNLYRVVGSNLGFTPDLSTLHRGELSGTLTEYQDSAVSASTTYTYKLEKVNAAGQAFSAGIVVTTPEQAPWPNNEPPGLTQLFVPYTGQTNKNWLLSSGQSGWNLSSGWQTGVGPDGVTPRIEVVDDLTSPYARAIIKRHWAAEGGNHTGWLGALASKVTFAGGPFMQYYLRFVFKLAANFEGHYSGTNKLVYFGLDADNKANSFFIGAQGASNAQTFNIHIDADTNTSGARYYRTGNKPIVRGVWHTLQMWLVAETAPSAGDGYGRVWLDYAEQLDWNCVGQVKHGFVNGSPLNGISFTGDEAPGFNGTQFFLYWGGSGTDTKLVDDNIMMGEMHQSGSPLWP